MISQLAAIKDGGRDFDSGFFDRTNETNQKERSKVHRSCSLLGQSCYSSQVSDMRHGILTRQCGISENDSCLPGSNPRCCVIFHPLVSLCQHCNVLDQNYSYRQTEREKSALKNNFLMASKPFFNSKKTQSVRHFCLF